MQPEECIKTITHFKGKSLTLREDLVLLPSGIEFQREIIEHSSSVVILPVDEFNNIFLVEQYRHAIKEYTLEAPAGGINQNESPLDAAHRELEEETGYHANSLKSIGTFWSSPGYCNERLHAFIGQSLTPIQSCQEIDETITLKKIPIEKISTMVSKNEIKDSKTISIITLVLMHLGLS